MAGQKFSQTPTNMQDFGHASGWEASANAWIALMGEHGDFARRYILDPPLINRLKSAGFQRGLDVGCGEGRSCRLLGSLGIAATGLDPAPTLVRKAIELDHIGEYFLGYAENMPFADNTFDLVLSYLSLISISDPYRAISEMTRVLQPSGTLLVVHLHSIISSGLGQRRMDDVGSRFSPSSYFHRAQKRVTWSGIDVLNWHRPLADYFDILIGQGLTLRSFSEPTPIIRDCDFACSFNEVPHFIIMEWQKLERS